MDTLDVCTEVYRYILTQEGELDLTVVLSNAVSTVILVLSLLAINWMKRFSRPPDE